MQRAPITSARTLRHRNPRNPRRPRTLEQLEDRRVLTGIQLWNQSLFLTGSAGDDQVTVSRAGDTIAVALTSGETSLHRSFPASQVREILFTGGDGNDRLANQTGLPTRAWGGAGDDILVGGSGPDELVGGPGHDLLDGGAGADRIWGAEGNDLITGGSGDDQVWGGAGHDQIFGELGDDSLHGEHGIDRVFGDQGRDTVTGGAGDDLLYGGSGDDILWGHSGADVLAGEAGNDYLNGGTEGDWLYGGSGDDVLVGDSGGDVLNGNRGSDALFGGPDGDWLYGGDDYDWLLGEGGDDLLEGGAGGNYLAGGDGYNWVFNRSWVKGYEAHAAYAGLSQSDLHRLAGVAEANWQAAGLNASGLEVAYRIADLPGNQLAVTLGRGDGSSLILVDADAAGVGWFVDATPTQNEEFWGITATAGITITGAAAGRFDLLSVLHHEIGHAAGIDHQDGLNVMMEGFVEGVRLLPDRSLVATAGPVEVGAHYWTANQVLALFWFMYMIQQQQQAPSVSLSSYNATFGTPHVPGPSANGIYDYHLQRNRGVSRIPAMLNPYSPGNMHG